MRRFVTVSHTADADGRWSLDDLPGSGGRADVVARNVQAALALSHGLRADVESYSHFVAPRPRTVRIEGARIQKLHPDERSTAARLQQALQLGWAAPDWKEVQRGLGVAALRFGDLLDELKASGTLVLLDPEGEPVGAWVPPPDPIFLLSDHVPFTPEEYQAIESVGAQRVSLGPHWYHGNLAIAVVQWWLDQRAPAPVAGDGP